MATVIIVPGVGGSQLWTKAFTGVPITNIQIWLDYVRMPSGFWTLLELGPDGVTKKDPTNASIIPAAPLWEFYTDTQRYFQSRGWKVRFAELDWRSFNRLDGTRLRDLIFSETFDGSRVAIVAHSRGGLVTRAALAQLPGGPEKYVTAVVGLGTPHGGSMTAVQLAAGWAPSKVTLYTVLGYFGVLSLAGSPLPRLNQMINNWPSTYELFPPPDASYLPPENLTAIYDPQWWALQGVEVNATHLASAKSYWGALPKPPTTLPWYDVIGYGYTTPFALGEGKVTTPGSMFTTQDGDGAVVKQSARNPLGGVTIQTPQDHQSMAVSGITLDWVQLAITQGLTSSVVIPPPGGRSPPAPID